MALSGRKEVESGGLLIADISRTNVCLGMESGSVGGF